MDDRDLEARLRMHLHRRFDGADVPRELHSSVEQLLATQVKAVAAAPLRFRLDLRLGVALAAAAAVVAVAVLANLPLNRAPVGQATPSPSPSLTPAERVFFVLPPKAVLPAKADTSLATEVLSARLRALGIGNFSSGGGDAIEFMLPMPREPGAGPSDDAIRAVLSATGEVAFVPLPESDYGSLESPGPFTAEVGKPLPKVEPALFGWDGVATIERDTTTVQPGYALSISLKAAAAQAFGDYTTAHVGAQIAIVIDGRVALLPRVRVPITGGEVSVELDADPLGTGDAKEADAVAAAILIGGELPEAWRGAPVPILITRDEAVAGALEATHGGTPYPGGGLSTELKFPNWHVRWSVEIDQVPCVDTSPCATAVDMLVMVDAVTREVTHIGVLVP